MVVRDFLLQHADEFRALRTWTYQTHLALQHVPQLRNLVHARKPEEFTHACDSWIVIEGPGGSGIRLRVRPHRSKFVTTENSAVAPNSFLTIQNRPGGS